MDDLTFDLRSLCKRNRDGSHATQADRLRALTLASRQLREAGFRQMRASSLKGKHVDALLKRWQAEGLSAGTLKNRVAQWAAPGFVDTLFGAMMRNEVKYGTSNVFSGVQA